MKAIKIKSTTMPINFEDDKGNVVLSFEFSKDDKSIKKLTEVQDTMIKEVEAVLKTDKEPETLETAKKALEKAFDSLLGKGAFSKIYALNKSIFICMQYLVAVVDSIIEEITNERETQLMGKYTNLA